MQLRKILSSIDTFAKEHLYVHRIVDWFTKRPEDESLKIFPARKLENLPEGRIVEGTSTIQCVCPVCPYGTGRADNFISGIGGKPVVVKCDVCGNEYWGLLS